MPEPPQEQDAARPAPPARRWGLQGWGRSRWLISLLALLVTGAFAYVAVSGVHLGEAWQALRESDWWWLGPALVALAASMLARALRWRALFAPGRRPPLAAVGNAMMVGYLYNNILPARSGEVARVVVLDRRSSAQPAEIVGTVVLERIYDVMGVLLIFFAAEPWLPAVSWATPAAVAAGVLALAIAAAATVLAVWGDAPMRALLGPLRRLPGLSEERLEHTLAELAHGLSGLRRPGVALLGLLWTIAAWLLTALLAYLVTLAFHMHVPFAAGVLVSSAVGLAMILPAPPAAVGVFEGAALLALRAYKLPHSTALSYAVVLHLVNFIPFIVVGVALVHHNLRHGAGGGETAAARELGEELPAAHDPVPVQLQPRQGAKGLQPVYGGGSEAD